MKYVIGQSNQSELRQLGHSAHVIFPLLLARSKCTLVPDSNSRVRATTCPPPSVTLAAGPSGRPSGLSKLGSQPFDLRQQRGQ